MGSKINPKFVMAADNLIKANKDLQAAEKTGDQEKIDKAFELRQQAEAEYCNLPGMIAGDESEDTVQAQIDKKMAEVSIFYS